MKLTFDDDVIGDDAPESGARRTIVVNALSGAALVQTTPLAGGTNPFQASRHNISGQAVFTVTNVFATVDLANVFMAAEYGRIGVQADLLWQRATTLFTAEDAVCVNVTFAPNGVQVLATYTFAITTLTPSSSEEEEE